MATSADEANSKASFQEKFVWDWQSNIDPWNKIQNAEWISYPDTTSLVIETAYKGGLEQIIIDKTYRINLKDFVQQHIDDSNRQRPVRRRRRCLHSSLSTDEKMHNCSRNERLFTPIGVVSGCSASKDTRDYGSQFILEWSLTFTEGRKSKTTFNSIFSVLVEGLQLEGQNEPVHVVNEIVSVLKNNKDENVRKTDKKRIKKLQECCVILYTKDYYIHRVVNNALRTDDRTKVNTLGPFCYLLFDYIGRHRNTNPLINRLRKTSRSTESRTNMTLYRGDYVSNDIIEEYRQAVGSDSKYFKWLPFVSTSLKPDVAECFTQNVFYIIEMQSRSSGDQCADLKSISNFKDEEEILLQPGVRFQVKNIEFDKAMERHLVGIQIIPSYISTLQ